MSFTNSVLAEGTRRLLEGDYDEKSKELEEIFHELEETDHRHLAAFTAVLRRHVHSLNSLLWKLGSEEGEDYITDIDEKMLAAIIHEMQQGRDEAKEREKPGELIQLFPTDGKVSPEGG